ncbi:MerR family transcriptional regulator [Paenibacillus sp. 1001270B_150601_E10]|uniref:MerR family transcriptional regulator n=1 Tax=Paenibacillus sp. 1001270B_150601_E10 TaxID=2787079 RepID=UPI0018A05662|nr:MerR family transcriptional regulator [Paenibacillus sp. 1001270B_150601_E10]
MKILEAARQLGMTTRTIRYYEERGLIKLVKDADNGYREISVDDLKVLQVIGMLRELGLSIDEIQLCLDDVLQSNLKSMIPLLQRKREELGKEMVQIRLLMKQMDQLTDRLLTNKEEQVMEEMRSITERSKSLKHLREDWKDRWNFNAQSKSYDLAVRLHEDPLDVHADYEAILERTADMAGIMEGERGLDLGIGTGNLAALCEAQGAFMTGIDQSEGMLMQCREKHPSFRLLLGNMMELPLVDEKFDFVVSTYALHHLTDEQKLIALEEIDHVLLDHGRIVIADLMFVDQAHRLHCMNELKEAGCQDKIEGILDEYYGDRSQLAAWWREHGYEVKEEQLNMFMHLIYAKKNGRVLA